jgi:hypothetical protein
MLLVHSLVLQGYQRCASYISQGQIWVLCLPPAANAAKPSSTSDETLLRFMLAPAPVSDRRTAMGQQKRQRDESRNIGDTSSQREPSSVRNDNHCKSQQRTLIALHNK